MTEPHVPQTTGPEAVGHSRADPADMVQFHRSLSEARLDMLIWLGCGLLVMAFVIVEFYERATSTWPFLVFMVLVAAAVFVLPISVTVYRWLQARQRKELLIEIGREGLRLPTHLADAIRWEDVSSLRTMVQIISGVRKTYLLINVGDPSGYRAVARGPLHRLNDRYCNWWYGTPFNLRLDPLEGEPADVVEAIKQRAPKALLENSDLSLW